MSSLHHLLGICAGKQSVADYLTEKHGFVEVYVASTRSLPPVQGVALQQENPRLQQNKRCTKTLFHDVESLLEFVTERWRERWVTTGICNEAMLKILLQRPSFILVSVDASVSLRWQRFKQK